MSIQAIAELASALAAFLTVGLALIELSSRSSSKKAEAAIDIYADFLFIQQQLDYAVGSIESLTKKAEECTQGELKAFAETHMLDSSLSAKLQKIESVSITTSDYSAEQGKASAKIILDFVGAALNLISSVNTFYATIQDQENVSAAWMHNRCIMIRSTYEQMVAVIEDSGTLLRANLKRLHNWSNAYIAILFTLIALFFILCLILH